MYEVGDRIIYGAAGVCEIEAVGPIDLPGAKKDVDYYTLSPVYEKGQIFAPVDTSVFTRPVLTRDEALSLIRGIPDIEENIFDDSNPRELDERYRGCMKSGNCTDLLRLIRAVYAKRRRAAGRGRRLGQVDERNIKKAEELLHNELACALGIRPDEVRDFIAGMLEG